MGKIRGWVKGLIGAVLGILGGASMMYLNVVVDKVVKPSKPVANFAVTTDGLTANFQNYSSGDSGWWDFGDGSPLEPFDGDLQAVAHTYPKPGTYTCKLTVRNFLMEENTRTVPVDLSASAPQNLPPSITGLAVEPVSPQAVAPAAFQIRGQVQNSEKAILDLGDDKPVLITENGPIDRLVVIEKPGQFPIQLTAFSGKEIIQQSKTVTVSQPTAGSLSVILRVFDSGSRTERKERTATIPVPVPAKAGGGFEKVVPADAGYTVAEVRVGTLTSKAARNIKAEVAQDRRSVRLTGEWVGDAKAAGGSDLLVPLTLVQEKSTQVNLPVAPQTAILNPGTPKEIPLPPQPRGLSGHQRKMSLEFRQAVANGSTTPIQAVADLKLPWSVTKDYPQGRFIYQAEPAGDRLRVSVTVQPTR